MGWLDLSNVSNIFRQSYINGFLDVSRTLIVRGDASLNGNLFIAGDVSLNGNLRANYPDSTIPPSAIIGGVSTGIFVNDISASKRMFVDGDVSLNSKLFVAGDVSLNGNLRANYPNSSIPPSAIIGGVSTGIFINDISASRRMVVAGDVSFNSKLFVAGDVSLNGNLTANYPNSSIPPSAIIGGVSTGIFINDISASKRMFVDGDVSLNSKLFVAGDVSLNGSVAIGNDITIVGRLNVKNYTNQNIINTTTTNYQLIVSEDLSLNGRLVASGDSSFNGNVYTTGFITAATQSMSDNSTRVATTAYTRNLVDTSLNNALANYSTKSVIDSSLALYSTKAAVDTSLGLYYTKTAVDASVNTNYYNKSTIDASINTNYYNKSTIDASVNNLLANNYSTKSVIDTSLALYYTKTAIDASVNTNYYNKSTIDSSINNLLNTSYSTKSTIDASLNLKANIESPTFTGTVGGITKSMVGLADVDNTSDANKPVSSATQTALNLKANLANPTFTGIAVIPTGNLTTLNVFGDASLNGNLSLNGSFRSLRDISVNSLTIGYGGGRVDTNTAFGFDALKLNTTAGHNIAIGYQALQTTTTGDTNVAIGSYALTFTTGYSNTAIGYEALRSNVSSSGSVAVGKGTLRNSTATGTAVGYFALNSNTSGGSNTAVGFESLSSNTVGNHNTSVGHQAAKFATGGSNTVVGSNAMKSVSGSFSVAVGHSALEALTSGGNNTAIGYQSLQTTTSGATNVAVGSLSLKNNTGSNNVAVGYNAGTAGTANTTGSNNTFIGYQAQSNGGSYNNSTALGAGATITGSNQVVLGTASEKVVMPGDASLNGNIVIGRNLTVIGNLAVQNYQNQNIINTTTTNYQLIVSEDLSLNGRLCVSSDTSLNGKLFVANDISCNGNLSVKPNSIDFNSIRYGINNQFSTFQYNYQTPNTAIFDSSGFAILKNIDSSSSVIYSTIDVSVNGNLFVGRDISYNGNLYLTANSIDPMAIRYGISNQFGAFQYNYTTPNTASYDADGFGVLRYIDSSSQVLYSKTDLSLNGNLYVNTDISLNGNLYVKNDISLNGNLYVNRNVAVGKTSATAALDVSGAIKQSAWTSGQIIQAYAYSASLGNTLTSSTATTGAAFIVGAFTDAGNTIFQFTITPKSTNSIIYTNFDCYYTIAGTGTDSFESRIVVTSNSVDTAISKKTFTMTTTIDSSFARAGGANLFPLFGAYKNTSLSTITVKIQAKRGTAALAADDNTTIDTSTWSCYYQEVQI